MKHNSIVVDRDSGLNLPALEVDHNISEEDDGKNSFRLRKYR